MAFDAGMAWAGGALFPVAVGVGSSFTHCAGMCAPIHLYLGSKSRGSAIWLYHAGRITGYASLGAAVGWLGSRLLALDTPALRAAAGWTLAILYLLFAVQLLGLTPQRWSLEARLGGLFPARLMARLAGSGKSGWLFPAGFVAAALPCPSTHAVLLYGMGLSSPLGSAAAMAALGVATLPVFALLPRAGVRRAGFFGQHYAGFLGVAFLGLAAWRIYGALGTGTPACH